MSSQNGRAEGMPWLSPYLTVRDVSRSVEFYQKAFGFERKAEMAGPDGKVNHAELTYKDALVMLGAQGAFGGTCQTPASQGIQPAVNLYLYCEDVDALFARAKAAGATVGREPETMFWGDRICRLFDPDGHSWSFATHVGQQQAVPA